MPSRRSKIPPAGWTEAHSHALSRHARNHEDAKSIAILLEAEFPELRNVGGGGVLDERWIQERMDACGGK